MVKKKTAKPKTAKSKAVVILPKTSAQQLQPVPPSQIISEAIARGSNLAELEKVMELQERYEANQAKKAFSRDMALVQGLIKSVERTETNDQTHSKYADFDAIVCQTKKVYTEKGFYVSFYEGETKKENHIRICATVGHTLGHEKQYYYDIPLDGKGIAGRTNMIPIHGKGSSTTYAKRYLICMIWNIPLGDDTDGDLPEAKKAQPEFEPPPEKEKAQDAEFTPPPSEMDQEMLNTFIARAIYFCWNPNKISELLLRRGHHFTGKITKSMKVTAFTVPIPLDEYNTLLDEVSKKV